MERLDAGATARQRSVPWKVPQRHRHCDSCGTTSRRICGTSSKYGYNAAAGHRDDTAVT
jgi:hypothetical protein